MAIKWLLTDFYGTLVKEDDSLTRDICRRICLQSSQNINMSDVSALWWQHMHEAFDKCCGRSYTKLADIQRAILYDLAERFESRVQPEVLLDEILRSWMQPRPYEDMRIFLAQFPLPICVVTNADNDVMQAALSYTQLRFEHVITSQSAGCYKPCPGIFQLALDTLGVQAHETLFVGDSLMYDIYPAGQAGMHTAWINRSNRPAGDIKADLTAGSLMKLRQAIIR